MNITPEPEEIVQAEEPYEHTRPINVAICGPVQTRELPAAGYPGYRTETAVGTAVAVRLVAMEPRRRRAVILPSTQDLWISTSQAGAQAGAGGAMRIPTGQRYPIDHIHEVWACAVTGTTDIGIETINWSE